MNSCTQNVALGALRSTRLPGYTMSYWNPCQLGITAVPRGICLSIRRLDQSRISAGIFTRHDVRQVYRKRRPSSNPALPLMRIGSCTFVEFEWGIQCINDRKRHCLLRHQFCWRS